MDVTVELRFFNDEQAAVEYVTPPLLAHGRRLLGRRRHRLLALPYYDAFSDSLIWTDETPWRARFELVEALRPLRHYRMGLVLGEPRPYAQCWELGRRLFPGWAGFHAPRCQPSPWLQRIYRAGRAHLYKGLGELSRAAGGGDLPT